MRQLVCAAGFALVALLAYLPSLHGPFVSDDWFTVPNNPFVNQLDGASVLALLDPFGPAVSTTTNYAPLHLLVHAVQFQLFGAEWMLGYHLTNLLLHVGVSLLFAKLLLLHGLGVGPAFAAGAIFLLHPANVEAVAWISQLKSVLSLALALLALLLRRPRPALALLVFGLALLTKPTAAFALPVALAIAWVGEEGRAEPRASWLWLLGWAALFLAFAGVELAAFQRGNADLGAVSLDAATRLRGVAANAARYAWMAATASGLSAFHQPEPARSWLDPWCLAGLALLGGLSGRGAWALSQRRIEGVYWVLAGASFAPVSQLFPFVYPLADRYLYAILPGLLGALGFALAPLPGRLRAALPERVAHVALGSALALVCLTLGVRAHERAGLWTSMERLVEDAAANYPDGTVARIAAAERAAASGDAQVAAAELRRAFERGYWDWRAVLRDPKWSRVAAEPAVEAVLREMAAWWIDRFSTAGALSQRELYARAYAHGYRREYAEARADLERALELGGPQDEQIRTDLARLARRLQTSN